MSLKTLKELLHNHVMGLVFPCIRDLVDNGLTSARFSAEDYKPSRQDITQYIATWFKYIGVSEDECQDWLIEYCLSVLAPISSSSRSQIRHSTKSCIKYVYNSDVPFHCRCEDNLFKASCDHNCSVYDEMFDRHKAREAKASSQSYEPEPQQKAIAKQSISIKDKYREQFVEALEFAHTQINKGTASKDIVTLLNSRGFKTKTGRKWTYSILNLELKHNR